MLRSDSVCVDRILPNRDSGGGTLKRVAVSSPFLFVGGMCWLKLPPPGVPISTSPVQLP